MKVWAERHGAICAALTLVAMLACSGCRESSSPEATPGDAKAVAADQPASVGSAAQPNELSAAGPRRVTIPVGTALSGHLENTVATDKSHVGDPVLVRTSRAVIIDQRALVPAGSAVHGTVTHVRAAGRMKGAAELTIRFTELVLPDGLAYPVTCEPLRLVVKGDGKETAAEIGGGAAIGGLLGGAIGGGDDVLGGAAIGAAVGTGVAAATPGEQIVLPAGKSLMLRLSAPVEF